MSRVLFHDKYDVAGVQWKVTAGGGTLTRTTTDGMWNTGGGALQLVTSTVGAEATEVHRYHARPVDHPIVAFGARFAPLDEAISNIAFYLGYRTGGTWYRGKLLHNYSTNTWQYDAGEGGTASNVTLLTRDPAEVSSRGMWHEWMLAVDFSTLRHVDLVIDETSYATTVTQKALRSAADATVQDLMDFAIETTNLGGSPAAGTIVFDRMYAVAFESGVGSVAPYSPASIPSLVARSLGEA
jgi:hypothetical protein